MLKKSSKLTIRTCEMHTCGSAVRIVESIEPPIQYPEKSTILEKKQFLQDNYDFIRQMTILEPRGHRDMFTVFITDPDENSGSHYGLLFSNIEGFFSMCGHITIAVGRYLLEKKKVTPTIPETEIQFDCPCGVIKVSVEWDGNRVGNTKFVSVPSYIHHPNYEVHVPELQRSIICEIAFGGNFFVFVTDKQLGLDINRDPPSKFVDLGYGVLTAVRKRLEGVQLSNNKLVILAGIYISDYKETNDVTNVICVNSPNGFDRCSCGSGTTALTASQYLKGNLKINQKLLTRNPFVCKDYYLQGIPIKEVTLEKLEGKIKSVVVEMTGRAYFLGENLMTYEEDDHLKFGFLV